MKAKRPFTGDVAGCRRMQADLETASRLQVTGFLSNAHLIQDTTPETVVEGWRLTEQVAEAAGRPVRGVAVMREIANDPAIEEITAPLLVMERRMLPPWMLKRGEGNPSPDDERLPAARPIPIGRPRPIEMPRPRRHES